MTTNLIDKKSFVLYHDMCKMFQELSDEQAGQLIKYIIQYSENKTQPNPAEPTGLSGLLATISIPFKNHIDRDFERFLDICERNRNNGVKGGRKPTKRTQSPPVKPDNDKDNDNDKDINKDKVISFIKENNLDEQKVLNEIPKCKDWFKSKGKPVKDWNATFRNWLRNEKMGGLARYKNTQSLSVVGISIEELYG